MYTDLFLRFFIVYSFISLLRCLSRHYILEATQRLLRYIERIGEPLTIAECKLLALHTNLEYIGMVDDMLLAYTGKDLSILPERVGKYLLHLRKVHAHDTA
jgi:hypothetical protein